MSTAVTFYRRAFLAHNPTRAAAMQSQDCYTATGRKYIERPGALSDNQIAALLRGHAAYAVPYATAGLAQVLAFDVDSDHLPDPAAPVRALLAELARRHLWAFAQYDPTRGRGYVWAPFAELTHAGRIAILGDAILAAIQRPGWKVEHRTSTANAGSDTRLPLCRHVWTGRRGLLLLDGQQLDLDADLDGALTALMAAWQPNPTSALPDPPSTPAPRSARTCAPTGSGITIDRYNADTDLVALLESYGSRPANRRTMYCCGHDDRRRASLLIWAAPNGKLLCKCLSQHHDCPLAGQGRDAFGVYCAMEGIDAHEALQRLNGRTERATPPAPQTRPVAPGAAPRNTPHAQEPPQRPAQTVTTPADGRRTAAEHPQLTKSARRILAEIARHPSGYILGKNRLAEALELDRSTVRRNLRALERAGAIRTEQRGYGQTDIYHALPLPQGGQMPPTCKHETPSRESESACRGGQSAPPSAPVLDDQADDQADPPVSRDELLPGAELLGPGGAFAVLGGAAYVPPEAEPWYAAICAASAPPVPPEPEPVAQPLDLGLPADPPAAAPAPPSARTAPKWARALCGYHQQVARMSESELAGELRKWRNKEQKSGPATWLASRIAAVEREIDRREDAALARPLAADAEPGAALPPPSCSAAREPAPVAARPQRRVWRSPFVRVDAPLDPLPPPTWGPVDHPIAHLGTDPEAMRVAHEHCQAVLRAARDVVEVL